VFVLATAGHVDHGKSTLVRALTGMEPDRWAEEKRRGMTIDLGYAWTTIGTEVLAFVDVPGHQRFIGNMLAGLGPVAGVLFVVAADDGWSRQSDDHLAAIDALGLKNALLAVTRSDLADPAPVIADAQARLARSSLGGTAAVAVSGRTGAGLDELREGLAVLLRQLPTPPNSGPVRLWIDRVFTVAGSGTVVTGTLSEGCLSAADEVHLNGRKLRVRGLQQLGAAVDTAHAPCRVAVNLRGLATEDVHRGDALLTGPLTPATALVDVRLDHPTPRITELMLHVGTAAVPAVLRPLDERHARLRLIRPLPLRIGDRGLLRDPGTQTIIGGFQLLDADPPPLVRRGAARQRVAALLAEPNSAAESEQRRAAITRLVQLVDERASTRPLDPGVAHGQALRELGVTKAQLPTVIAAAGLTTEAGRIIRTGTVAQLGPAETGLRALLDRLGETAFAAPERGELQALGLGPRELAVAVTRQLLIRLADDVYLLPSALLLARRLLGELPQPFTTSEARQKLSTTRRVAIPLLEELDARTWTRRIDGTSREVVTQTAGTSQP
jgi:selenocysteine-specific elongation factor